MSLAAQPGVASRLGGVATGGASRQMYIPPLTPITWPVM
ncbi:hypothetical protein FAIPA1_80081 [Frankia sp. AiPs1]